MNLVVFFSLAVSETMTVQNLYFRFRKKDGGWLWLQSKCKVIYKNSKKVSIVFTHCPIRYVLFGTICDNNTSL